MRYILLWGGIILVEFIDKTEEKAGTKINRKNLMAAQGFMNQETIFVEEDGSIVTTNGDGHIYKVTFNTDGSITETFSGEKTIMKTTKFEGNKIIEVVL